MKNFPVLCFDLGVAHTGVAISHEGELAEPLTTLFAKKDELLGKIVSLLAIHNPEKIVIGVPHHGPLVDKAKEISQKLSAVFKGEIVLFEEDFSSRQARSILSQKGSSHSSIKAKEHQTASAIILQNYLDSLC